MSNHVQSSVDWFSKESLNLKVKLENKKISIGEYAVTYFDLLRQAKEMHMEEITTAHTHGRNVERGMDDGVYTSLEYYKQKFQGGNNEQQGTK